MLLTPNLTEKKFNELIILSESKMRNIIKDTTGIEDNILNLLYPSAVETNKKFIMSFHKHLLLLVEKKLENVKAKRLYEDGWFNIDVYFLANFKAICPVIKCLFYDKGITTYNIKNNYNAGMINAKIISLCGNNIREFMREFNRLGEHYYQSLALKGILKEPTFKTFNSNGISKSIIQDILGRMRGFRENASL